MRLRLGYGLKFNKLLLHSTIALFCFFLFWLTQDINSERERESERELLKERRVRASGPLSALLVRSTSRTHSRELRVNNNWLSLSLSVNRVIYKLIVLRRTPCPAPPRYPAHLPWMRACRSRCRWEPYSPRDEEMLSGPWPRLGCG